MKNRKKPKADHSRLTRKLYLYMFAITSLAVALVVFLRFFVRGRVADAIVNFFQHAFRIDYDAAIRIYNNAIRNNVEVISVIAIAVCFFVLSRYLLARVSKYFNEINNGIDALVNGGDKEISLSSELDFIEQKLNALKHTLEERAREARQAEQRKNDMVMYLAHDIKKHRLLLS